MEGSNWTKNIESMGVLPLERDAPGGRRASSENLMCTFVCWVNRPLWSDEFEKKSWRSRGRRINNGLVLASFFQVFKSCSSKDSKHYLTVISLQRYHGT
jgi:hypothetical protein